MIHTYTLNGLQLQTGDILCLTFQGDLQDHPINHWRLLGLLVPGEVDHVAVYVGPEGRCVESAYRGVYVFHLDGAQWTPKKMYKYRGRFRDDFVGVAYPLPPLGKSGGNMAKCIFCKKDDARKNTTKKELDALFQYAVLESDDDMQKLIYDLKNREEDKLPTCNTCFSANERLMVVVDNRELARTKDEGFIIEGE